MDPADNPEDLVTTLAEFGNHPAVEVDPDAFTELSRSFKDGYVKDFANLDDISNCFGEDPVLSEICIILKKPQRRPCGGPEVVPDAHYHKRKSTSRTPANNFAARNNFDTTF